MESLRSRGRGTRISAHDGHLPIALRRAHRPRSLAQSSTRSGRRGRGSTRRSRPQRRSPRSPLELHGLGQRLDHRPGGRRPSTQLPSRHVRLRHYSHVRLHTAACRGLDGRHPILAFLHRSLGRRCDASRRLRSRAGRGSSRLTRRPWNIQRPHLVLHSPALCHGRRRPAPAHPCQTLVKRRPLGQRPGLQLRMGPRPRIHVRTPHHHRSCPLRRRAPPRIHRPRYPSRSRTQHASPLPRTWRPPHCRRNRNRPRPPDRLRPVGRQRRTSSRTIRPGLCRDHCRRRPTRLSARPATFVSHIKKGRFTSGPSLFRNKNYFFAAFAALLSINRCCASSTLLRAKEASRQPFTSTRFPSRSL